MLLITLSMLMVACLAFGLGFTVSRPFLWDVWVVYWVLALAKECRWFFGLQRDAVSPTVLALGAVLIGQLVFGPISSHFSDFWVEANLDCMDVTDSAPAPPRLDTTGEASIWVSYFLAGLRLLMRVCVYVPRSSSSSAFFCFVSREFRRAHILLIHRDYLQPWIFFFLFFFNLVVLIVSCYFLFSRGKTGRTRARNAQTWWVQSTPIRTWGARRGRLSCGTRMADDGNSRALVPAVT